MGGEIFLLILPIALPWAWFKVEEMIRTATNEAYHTAERNEEDAEDAQQVTFKVDTETGEIYEKTEDET